MYSFKEQKEIDGLKHSSATDRRFSYPPSAAPDDTGSAPPLCARHVSVHCGGAAIRENLKNINRYPDSASFYLKKKLSRLLGVGSSELIVGNGSDEIITLATKAFVGSGDEVVIAVLTV